MSQQPGLTDFFAMEASDYLERLDGVVSRGASPNAEEFSRLSRALRGSALMANQPAIAAAAGGLEQLARVLREGKRSWDAATRQLAVRAIDDLKVLVRKLATWSAADDAKARRLADELHVAAGGTAAPAAATGGSPDPSTRTFIAQQGATLASALDRTATSLAQHPDKRDVLQSTVKFMQPLRGIASLADFPPLPDLLEGLERGIAHLARGAAGGDPAAMFRAAAKAIARAAREVATAGKADPGAPEAAEFVRLLSAVVEGGGEVVPIESLYYTDQGPHVVQEGTPAARPSQLSNLELVAHGEHLRQAADALERAPLGPQRELRAQALAGTFAALTSVGAGVFGSAVVGFARAARDALARGLAAADPSRLVRSLRDAAGVLTAAGREDESALARRLVAVTAGLAPGAPAPPPVTRAAPPPAPSEDGFGLAASFTRYERYVAALGMQPASLEELLAGPPASAPEAPAGHAAPAPTREVSEPAAGVIPITALCYSGPAAIERAMTLRAQVRAALAGSTADTPRVNDLLEEIFDLVQLGTGNA